jgi:tetratricopeptide (TPR) repeat protein
VLGARHPTQGLTDLDILDPILDSRRIVHYCAVPAPLLTAAMIVRDEASHLPGCLESIRDVVDEIVVVDTGSTDATVEIARSFGAEVHHHPWRGDFAAARNAGLERSRGRWILYIDADERLRAVSPVAVRAELSRAGETALRVRLHPFSGATPYWEHRLWRADPRIRFRGAMHEKVAPAIGDLARSSGRAIGESTLVLHHLGYDGNQAHKHARNLPLLQAELAAEPERGYNWRHLARVLDGLGDSAGASAALDRAVGLAWSEGGVTGALTLAELIQRMASAGENPTALIDAALSRFPDNAALIWLKAKAEITHERHIDALRWLDRLDVDPSMPVEDTVAYPTQLFVTDVPAARGLCLFRAGYYREAAAAYAEAERSAPEALDHRARRVLAQARSDSHPSEARPPYRAELWPASSVVTGVTVDLGGVPIAVRATDGFRAQAISALLGRAPLSDEPPAARLRFDSHRIAIPAHAPDETQGSLRIWNGAPGLVIAHAGGITAQLTGEAATVGGHADDLSRAFRHVAPFVLAAQLAPHDRFLLHAGAVARGGQAVLILGDSGSGKSTLIAGALQRGWSVLSDDLVLLRAENDEIHVMGIPRALTVPDDIVSFPTGSWPIPGDPRRRHQLNWEDWQRGWVPVGGLVAVGHGDSELSTLSALTHGEALPLLLRAMLSRDRGHIRDYMRIALTTAGMTLGRVRHARDASRRTLSSADALGTAFPAAG